MHDDKLPVGLTGNEAGSVSYTHLDVYKRQAVLLLVEQIDQRDRLRHFDQALAVLIALSCQPLRQFLNVIPCLLYTSRCV